MKRSILGLMYLIAGMRQLQIPVDERLKSIGLNVSTFDPSSLIHPNLEFEILKVVAADVEPELGLDIGQHYALAGYGPLLMLLLTSASVEVALQSAIDFQVLTHLSGKLSIKRTQGSIALEYDPKAQSDRLSLFRAQCEVSGTLKFLQDIHVMAGLSFPQIRVELPFSKPMQANKLEQFYQYYGQNLFFDCDQARFVFNDSIIDIKIPSSDAISFNLYQSKCEIEIERFKEDDVLENNIVEQVREFMEIQLGAFPSMSQTAKALNLPERTLRHQLQQQNTSYSQIREKLIQSKALKMINENTYSIEQIAEILGYSEPAAFNHAFKRWFGHSPRQFRK